MRFICTDTASCPNGIVGFWPEPLTATTNYYFNNEFYNYSPGGNYFDLGQHDHTKAS